MIGQGLIDLFFSLFRILFGATEVVSLPFDLVGVLADVLVYGNWVIGIDLLAIFVGSVIFWWGVHMSIGLAVWLWKMLPLT